jgi:Spy/CpxP family protein refolding chaperone
MQSSREQMEVILTDEQRQQLEQHRQHHQTNPQDETQP